MAPHMDMSGGSTATDYSSFEYQQISTQLFLEAQDFSETNPGSFVNHTIEPLSDIGGLANNEVAEIVAIETYAGLEFEDESADQNVGSSAELRGVSGINLPNAPGVVVGPGGQTVEGQAEVYQGDEDLAKPLNRSISEDRVLQIFRSHGGLPFDDQTNGPGGSGSIDSFHNTKNFRQLTGRGPVLDQNDDFNVNMTVNASDTLIEVGGTVRTHIIWDVAETSDAGRAFSVPDDM